MALSETIGEGFGAWVLKNEAAWEAARKTLPPLLGCQPQPISAELSARVLQFQGLSAGGAKQPDQMSAFFRGAAAVSQEYPFTDAMFPPDHYYVRAWEAAVAAPVPAPVALIDPNGQPLDHRVQTYVNGERTREIVPGLYSVVQVAVAPRGVLLTVPLDPSAEDPRLPPIPALQDALAESDRALRKRRNFLIASGAAAVAAIGVEGAAWGTARRDGVDPTLDPGVWRLHDTGLVLAGASGAMFVLSWSVGR